MIYLFGQFLGDLVVTVMQLPIVKIKQPTVGVEGTPIARIYFSSMNLLRHRTLNRRPASCGSS